MTKDRKIKLAEKFVEWLRKSGCRVNVTCSNSLVDVLVFEVVIPDPNGLPFNTVCYTTCEARGRSAEECWVEILERRCCGHLAVDRFDLLGLGKADTMEELELRLEIVDAG